MEYDLVFEGGGAKGMVFVGAMQEFEARGHTFKRLLGTSAGAITATLLAAGYNAQEMLEALGEQENGQSIFNSFLAKPGPFEKAQIMKSATLQFLRDVDLPLIPDFIERKLDEAVVQWLAVDPNLACSYSFLEYGGLFSANHFIRWMEKRLDTGEHNGKPRQYSKMTLAQFFDATGCTLTMVASDTTAGEMLVLNHKTAPDLPVVRAVRMSMSIPILWQEVIWQPEWGKYRGRDMEGHAIVDGGILSNFPIDLFISQKSYVTNVMGTEPGSTVLGMFIDEAEPVPGVLTSPVENKGIFDQTPFFQRINNLVNTTLSARDKMVRDSVEDLVVRLPAHGFGTTEFNMTDERRSLLVKAGCDAMKNYFDRQRVQPVTDPNVASFGVTVGETPAEEIPEQTREEADRIAMRLLG